MSQTPDLLTLRRVAHQRGIEWRGLSAQQLSEALAQANQIKPNRRGGGR